MSYGNTAGLDAYWLASGYSPETALTEAEKDALRVKASRYVDGLGWEKTSTGRRYGVFPGTPVAVGAEWPRTGAKDFYGNDISDSEVPVAVLNAVYEAAWFVQNGGDLNRAIAADQVVTREKVDVLEVSYATSTSQGGVTDTRPMIPAVLDALAPVMSGGSNPYGITMVVSE